MNRRAIIKKKLLVLLVFLINVNPNDNEEIIETFVLNKSKK